jgi:four helix bundle protein
MKNGESKVEMGQRKNIVLEKSFGFGVRMVRLSQYLAEKKREHVLGKQVLRAGTSIGANVEEANNASSSRVLKNYFDCHCEAFFAEAISLFSLDSRMRLLRSARNDD